jgi:hypothetical protein
VIAIFDGSVWGEKEPFAHLKPGTLVIAEDPTRGGGGPDGPIRCYLTGRVNSEHTVENWRTA